HDAGDHTLAIGRVRDLSVNTGERAPLLFYSGQYGRFSAD
ncbi:MAG: flavin reductase, partial [Pseudomonadota bacterium]